MSKLRILELFGGIGACSKALERLGIDYEIEDYVEIDKYAVKSFNAIHNTNFEPQDICEWNKDIEADFIMHGSPCQDFSLAGKQAGGDKDSGTRSSLMYETIRIVEKLKPKYVIWENVKNLLSKKHRHNFNAYLEAMEQLGYISYYQVLNAKNYGIPQNRERVFTISIRKDINKVFTFPQPQELKLKLKDMLEDEVDEKYYLSDSMINYLENGKYKSSRVSNKLKQTETGICPTLDTMQGGNRQPFIKIKNNTIQGYLPAYDGDGVNISSRMKYQRVNVQKESIQTLTTSGGNDRGVVVDKLPGAYGRDFGSKGKIQNKEYCDTLTASMGTGGGNVPIFQNNLRIRKLTPKECWRLMGFDDEDFEKASKVNSNTQLYKQAGNSIVVNVLEAILKNLLLETNQDVITGQMSIYDYINVSNSK